MTKKELIKKVEKFDDDAVVTIYDDTTGVYDTIKEIQLKKNVKKFSKETCDYKTSDIIVISMAWDYYEK
jgi:hypothetical protein